MPPKLVHKGPTLDTLHMVESVLRKFDEPLSLNRIKALLPRKMMHAPLRDAIEHYKRLGCATEGSKGVMWTLDVQPGFWMLSKSQQPAWRNHRSWTALRNGRDCPLCLGLAPADLAVELATSWVTTPETAPLPGYACVISKQHVVEPFELPSRQRALFWEDTMVVARALGDLLHPVKMNYEIHGNTIPHLHLHLFPRFRGDPYEGGPINPSQASFHRSPRQIERIKRAIFRGTTGRRKQGR